MGENKSVLFWNSFINAVEAESRTPKHIKGASGFYHPMSAIGIDEKRNRLILVSAETDPRSASLAQIDIQNTMPKIKVVLARPIVANMSLVAKVLSEIIGKEVIEHEDLNRLNAAKDDEKLKEEFIEKARPLFEKAIAPIIVSLKHGPINIVSVVKEFIDQVKLISVEKPYESFTEIKRHSDKIDSGPLINLKALISYDPLEIDRRLGVCSIPMYEFSQDEIELFLSGKDSEHIKELLVNHDIHQYYFPPPDQLTLGLIDHNLANTQNIVEKLERVPNEGHPYGNCELIEREISICDMISALKEKKLIVEGEIAYSLTRESKELRTVVKFKPRESLFSKLSKIFSVKIDLNLKDFLP